MLGFIIIAAILTGLLAYVFIIAFSRPDVPIFIIIGSTVLIIIGLGFVIFGMYQCQTENKKEMTIQVQTQEQFIETNKEEINEVLKKFSDYYFDFTKQDYAKIQDDIFDWGTHSFVVKKNDSTISIEFTLIDNETKNVVESKIRKYN